MADNFRRMGDMPKAAKAFEQYLRYYPKGTRSSSARFSLAGCYEKMNRPDDALTQYNLLAALKAEQPFWANLATKTADQLRWEEAHPYLSKGNTP